MQLLNDANRTLKSLFIVVNVLMKVIFILGELMIQSSKEAFGLPINHAMQIWFWGSCDH